ncbi:DNA-binding transcriptional LysR family regulator [Arthrobacter pigmenti]|uniref:DNA-binding transcriptional LysR family regulator n=1 Tax=Arthrobacter pigmenti TaxID=271432 RepID=A0A846RVN4_9MICC|nr:DNA-binding transcriptional LysR family regulator [Arthrobacter pigmenti]
MPPTQLPALHIGFVPGVTPGKWVGRWRERNPDHPIEATEYDDDGALAAALRDGSVDIAFVRLPIDRDALSVIPLYEELAVVVVSKEHELSLLDEVPLPELDDEKLLDVQECGGPRLAVEVVASGAGVVVLPMSVARHYSRRDVVARVVPDAPTTTIAVSWIADNTTDEIEEFIGIVRGRTARSSRQPSAQQDAPKKKPAKGTQKTKQTGKDQRRKPGSTKGGPPAKGRGRRRR